MHRFYAACQNIDTVEQTAVDHAKALFGASHAYVQPPPVIDANPLALLALTRPLLAPRGRLRGGPREPPGLRGGLL